MTTPPDSERALLAHAHRLAGLRLAELAGALDARVARAGASTKGAVGEMLERALGADAGSSPEPDFTRLGVELKTIPVDAGGNPTESTHVCVAPAIVTPEHNWETSLVRRKLQRVLWVPIEAGGALTERRIGWSFLWSPSCADLAVLRADWEEIVEIIALGERASLSARLGTYLQIRPKGADGRSRVRAADATGAPAWVLPRGFYLRARYTASIVRAGQRRSQLGADPTCF